MEEKESVKVQRKRTKRKYSLPCSHISFDKEIQLVKAIVEFSNKGEKTVNYKTIKIDIHPFNISSELHYLEYLGLIKKVKRGIYSVDPKMVEFIDNLNWNKELEAKEILRDIVQRSWFGDLTSKIANVKGGKVKKDVLISELGKEASAHPTKDKKSIARLIEWMKYSGLIDVDENQNIVARYPAKIIERKRGAITPPEKEVIKIELPASVVFQVAVTPQTSENEIKEVIKKIKRALAAL